MPVSPDDIKRQLLAIFRQEQEEHLQAIRLILSGATYDEDTGNPRALTPAERDEVYRRFHSLKGAARAVDLESVEQIAHRAENVLGRLRAEEIAIPPNLLYRRLQEVMDAFEALALLQDSTEPNLKEATERTVQTAMRAIDVLESPSAQEPPAPDPVAPPTPEPATITAAPAIIAAAPIVEAAPARPVAEAVPVAPSTAEDVVRVSSKQLDALLMSVQQFQQEMERQQHFLETELQALEKRLQTSAADARAADDTHTLRQRYREYTWRMQRIAAQMTEEVQSARLVAVETAMEGMERMLRGIARQSGKDVALQVSGGAIRVDREVVQALRDPLTHILRNTISHGIEPESERLATGKPGYGNVMVRFRVRGTRLEIDVQDDGRGLNEANIRRMAATSHLLSPEMARSAPLEQVAQLIFQPGFSTFGAADRIAGRGLGLSIVAQAVARLGGEVRVLPAPGGGTLFRLLLPLSVATHRLLLVEINDQVFGLTTFVVEGLHRVAADRIEPVEDNFVLRLGDGSTVPVSDLGALMGLPAARGDDNENDLPLSVVVVRLGGERHALIVQRFRTEGVLQVRPLGPYLPNVPLFGGSVVLSDGVIGLTLLPSELGRRIRGGGAVASLASEYQKRTAAAQQQTPTILVADDSVTTRTLEKSILEAHGYRVRLAVDGEEALVLLRESVNRPGEAIDLVVSDLEMPRRTGFELLSAVREDPRLGTMPFILVTSREAFEDREQGLSLGADAYIVKQKFDQSALLATIEQLLRQV